MSFDPDKLQAAAQLGEVIRLHNETLEKLREFRRLRPYALPPNMVVMAEENLKENVQVLYKELNHLHKPAAERRRHACRQCHHVFAVSLPGGICDECRSRQGVPSQPAAYGMWPASPESESATVSDITPDPTGGDTYPAVETAGEAPLPDGETAEELVAETAADPGDIDTRP